MEQGFSLRSRHSHDNLHIALEGAFTPAAAEALLEVVRREHRAGARIFVDTAALRTVEPAGAAALRTHWAAGGIPAGQLFFKGEQGVALGPDGSRVLMLRRAEADAAPRRKPAGHVCCGNCAHCTCGHGKKHGTAGRPAA